MEVEDTKRLIFLRLIKHILSKKLNIQNILQK